MFSSLLLRFGEGAEHQTRRRHPTPRWVRVFQTSTARKHSRRVVVVVSQPSETLYEQTLYRKEIKVCILFRFKLLKNLESRSVPEFRKRSERQVVGRQRSGKAPFCPDPRYWNFKFFIFFIFCKVEVVRILGKSCDTQDIFGFLLRTTTSYHVPSSVTAKEKAGSGGSVFQPTPDGLFCTCRRAFLQQIKRVCPPLWASRWDQNTILGGLVSRFENVLLRWFQNMWISLKNPMKKKEYLLDESQGHDENLRRHFAWFVMGLKCFYPLCQYCESLIKFFLCFCELKCRLFTWYSDERFSVVHNLSEQGKADWSFDLARLLKHERNLWVS